MSDQPSRPTVEAAAALLRALSYLPRLQIALQVKPRESTPSDLGAQLSMEQPALAHHLRHLRTAGVVRRQRRGSHVVYTIAPGIGEVLDAAFACLAPPSPPTRPIVPPVRSNPP